MPRARTALLAFALLACAWLFHDAISRRFLDAWFTASLHYQHWSDQRAISHDEAKVRALADRLAAGTGERDRALAAYLYAINFSNHRHTSSSVIGTPETLAIAVPEQDRVQAQRLLASLSRATDVEAMRVALAACPLVTDCNRLAYAQALVRIEPGNAFGWSQLLKAHMLAGDEAAVRSDLHQLGASHEYRDGMGEAWDAIWSAAKRTAPDDAPSFGALGRQLMGSGAVVYDEDYDHDFRRICALPWPGAQIQPWWLGNHPESRLDCRRAAVLLANSADPMNSRWGWNWLDRDHPSRLTQRGVRAADARIQQLASFGGTLYPETSEWGGWPNAGWLAWAKAQKPAN